MSTEKILKRLKELYQEEYAECIKTHMERGEWEGMGFKSVEDMIESVEPYSAADHALFDQGYMAGIAQAGREIDTIYRDELINNQ